MANDLLSTVKSYISKVADGEHTPAELANSINAWIKESTESIKVKVEEEVTRSVSKMGFIKRAEFDELKAEVAKLKVGTSAAPVKAKKKSSPKKAADTVVAKAKSSVKAKSSKVSSPKRKIAATKTSAKPIGKAK